MRLAPLYQQDRDLAIKEKESALIIRQLKRRIGEIQLTLIERIKQLSIDKIEALGEALLDFTKLDDLETWLTENQE